MNILLTLQVFLWTFVYKIEAGFVEVGRYTPTSLAVAQIEFDVTPLESLEDHLETLIDRCKQSVIMSNVGRPSEVGKMENKLLARKLESFRSVHQDIKSLVGEKRRRSKRFLGIAIASTALALSFGNGVAIGMLNSRINVMIREEKTLFGLMEKEIEENAREIHLLQKALRHDEMINSVHSFLDLAIRKVEIVRESIIQVRSGRVPIRLLHQRDWEIVFNEIRNEARKNSFTVPISVEQIFACQATLVDDEIVLLVPVTRGSLELFEWHSIPSVLKENDTAITTLNHHPIERYLAVNRDKSFHAILRKEDLDRCQKVHGQHICEQEQSILRKNFDDSCLGSLFIGNAEQVNKLCPIKLRQVTKVEVRHISGEQFLVISPKATPLEIQCAQKVNRTTTKSPVEIVKIQEGCIGLVGTLKLEHLPHVKVDIRDVELDLGQNVLRAARTLAEEVVASWEQLSAADRHFKNPTVQELIENLGAGGKAHNAWTIVKDIVIAAMGTGGVVALVIVGWKVYKKLNPPVA